MTTIYFIRHSISQKINNIINSDPLQIQNEKQILSIEGEILASKTFNIDELKQIDILISSNYIRAISTAKYIADNNGIEINIIETFGERKFGVSSWDDIPKDFYDKQLREIDYKIGNGESQKEVRTRMLESLDQVLNNFKNKKVAIVTHSTAMFFLFLNWCTYDKEGIYYKGEKISPCNIENCAIFKMSFDDNNKLIDIKKI